MPKTEKSEFVKIDRGGYFLSLTVSGYHNNTISKSFGHSKRPISGFRHSGRPEPPTLRSAAPACAIPVKVGVGSNRTSKLDSSYPN